MASIKIVINKGDVFNRLTVIDPKPSKEERPETLKKRRCMKCLCVCGNTTYVVAEKLKSGHTTSCGCFLKENRGKASITHGLCKEPLFDVWRSIIARCDNPKDARFPYYGARGISYDQRWKEYNIFMEDMYGTFEQGLTLDRINVNLGYDKANCRWTNMSVQGHNKRLQVGGSSVFMGVSAHDKGRWMCYINIYNKRCYLHLWDTEQEAAKAFDDAASFLYQDRPNQTECSEDWIYEKVKKKLKLKGFIY